MPLQHERAGAEEDGGARAPREGGGRQAQEGLHDAGEEEEAQSKIFIMVKCDLKKNFMT